jgi:hypothetical protein
MTSGQRCCQCCARAARCSLAKSRVLMLFGLLQLSLSDTVLLREKLNMTANSSGRRSACACRLELFLPHLRSLDLLPSPPLTPHFVGVLTPLIRRHEGVEIMTWTPNYVPSPADAPLGLASLGDVSTEAPQNTTKWHNGLDVYLQHIFQKTHSNYINGQMLTQNFFSSRRYRQHACLLICCVL